MDWQQLVSLTIVILAGALLAAGQWRRRRFRFGRDTHCGCTAAGEMGRQSSIIFRARKGERREVLVKMK